MYKNQDWTNRKSELKSKCSVVIEKEWSKVRNKIDDRKSQKLSIQSCIYFFCSQTDILTDKVSYMHNIGMGNIK